MASAALRPLAETAFDAVREAALVVDLGVRHLPLVLANGAARRRFLDGSVDALIGTSLYALLCEGTDSTIEEVIRSHAEGKPSTSRVLNWRLPRGVTALSTELNVLTTDGGPRTLMLTLAEPSAAPGFVSSIEHLPLDLLILDTQLIVTYANAGAVRTAGNLPGGILNYSGLTLTPVAALPREVLQRALGGTHFHDDALAVPTPDGRGRWFEVDVQPLKHAAGIAGVAILSTEVTDRHLNKRFPIESERRLLALTEHASDIITVADQDGCLNYISGGITNLLGYSAGERRSQSIFEHIHPNDEGTLRAKFAQLVGGAITTFSQQFRIRHKDGSYRWLESSYVSALDNPLINGVVVNSRDITERRQVENRLAQREEMFRLAANVVNGVIFEWDIARGTVYRSLGVKALLGIDPDQLSAEGSAWKTRIHPADDPAYGAVIRAALHKGPGWTATYRIRDAFGSYRSILERALIQRNVDGVALRAIGCCVDISEIKRLTDLLAETQRAAKMGAWEYNYATGELTWTDEVYRIFETTAAEFAVSWDSMLAQCTPASRQRISEAAEAAQSGSGDYDLELEITTLKKRSLWVRVVGHLEKLEGRPFRAFGSAQNIQVQKLAQIDLENSTDWLKLSMTMANMHAWRWERANDELTFAIVDGQMGHLPRLYPVLKKLLERVHPKDRRALRLAIDHSLVGGQEVQQEFRLKARDGRYRAFATVARPTFAADGRPSGLVGVTQDVTARQESEARLRRSEEVLRTTTTNTADTLVLLDTDLRVRFINRAVLGMQIDEIIGRDASVLSPKAARKKTIARLRHVLKTAETATYEVELNGEDGRTHHFENRAVLVREDGIASGISITVRNVTERKRLEQEILDVSSRERQTIGRDLHDGLGQELTGVALMLRGLTTRIQKSAPESVAHVNEVIALVNQSIETARSLARGLLPVNTESGGLALALRLLVERSRDLYGFGVAFRAEVAPDFTLSETDANHVYRIAQEALTNAARHGGASSVDVLLVVNPQVFQLRIADDGRGIDAARQPALGMGLKIMKYRASMIGARFDIAVNHPSGVIVSVTGEQPVAMRPPASVEAK